MNRVGANPFENNTTSGLGGGRRVLRPNTDGSENYILRQWRASPEPFSTVLVFTVRYKDTPLATDDPSDAFCRIAFGTSSRLGEEDCGLVETDLFNGLALTVPGNCNLSVELVYGGLFDAAVDATQPNLIVDLAIAHGFNCCNARRTVKVGAVPANQTSTPFPIPLQAREAYLVNADIAVPSAQLNQLLTAGGQTISVDTLTKKSDGTVQYAHGATQFSLTTGGTAMTKSAVIWKLNL